MPQASSISIRHPLATSLETFADQLVGVRWTAQGSTEQGVDCVGLIVVLVHKLGIYQPGEIKLPLWKQVPDNNKLITLFAQYLQRVPKPCLGSVALFNQRSHNVAALFHAGVIGENYFYEASLPYKKVIKVSISDSVLADARAFFVFQRPNTPLDLEYV